MAEGDRVDGRQELRDLLIVALVAALILVWGAVVFFLVGERPTEWDYGSHSYIPGEAYDTTGGLPRGPAPPQVELPPASQEPRP